MVWIRTSKALIVMVLLVVLIALVPLYGILFPPLVDLPEHILISKLLWEKLSGVTHLDLEISLFLGYRLFPALMMIVIPFFKLWGISFVYLPKIVAMVLISLHAMVVTAILCFGLKDKSWKSCTLAVCFSVPAAVCMYSACWFIGFVNYTMAVTLLVPAIFLTERFLRSGKLIDATWLLFTLLMVYVAHPFATTFWLLWCLSRALAAIATRSVFLEWKRIILLGIVFSPILLYHFFATRGTQLAPSGHSFLSQSPFVSRTDWYHFRLRGLLGGAFLQADDLAESKVFALVAIALILVSIALAFGVGKNQRVKNLALSSLFLIFISSWIDEKFFPVPGGAWLAYDYRFSSTSYVICLALAGMALIRLLPVSTDKARYKVIFVVLAFFSALASADHLMEVRTAYARFDVQARKYMAKVLNHDKPTGIELPHSRYHPDGTFLNNYVCLTQPDCNVPGTTFAQGYVDSLYPVKVKGRKLPGTPRSWKAERGGMNSLIPFPSSVFVPYLFRARDDGLVGYWKLDESEPSDACVDSSGHGNMGAPYGTAVVDGKVNKARSFNGSGDYIAIPTLSIPDAITVAAWVYSESFAQSGFVVTKNPVNSQWALFFESDGFLKWRGAAIETNVVCPAPSNNKWHHIVGKQKGNAGSLYVDGVLCASGTLPAIGNAASSINIGRFDSVSFYYFTGRIDDVRIYNRALSDNEISRLFTSSDSRSRSPTSSKAPLRQ
ncbi:MAG: hypothetical protein QOC70_891 [Verrucomicrobiota bacterium]|jgi:hypothetical protein